MGAYIHRRILQYGASPNYAFIFAFATGGKENMNFFIFCSVVDLTLQRKMLALLSKGLVRVICDWQIVVFFSRKWAVKMIDGEDSILFLVGW